MAFMNKFCFTCSVRLGSIITGALTLVQGIVFLGVMLSQMDAAATITHSVNDYVETLRLEGQFYKDVAKNPKLVMTISLTFFSCLICSSLLLLYGCFQMRTFCMYPFVLFYLLYIFGLFVCLLVSIFMMKIKGNGLGDLILYSNLGGFALLFYLYTWSCVVSLIQIINELKQRLKQKLQVVENMKSINKIKVYKKNNTKAMLQRGLQG